MNANIKSQTRLRYSVIIYFWTLHTYRGLSKVLSHKRTRGNVGTIVMVLMTILMDRLTVKYLIKHERMALQCDNSQVRSVNSVFRIPD